MPVRGPFRLPSAAFRVRSAQRKKGDRGDLPGTSDAARSKKARASGDADDAPAVEEAMREVGIAVQRGMVSYTTDLWRAKFHPRVSDNPLIVKALKTLWPSRCEFIISNADAAKLRSASEHLLFMRECRVIIVLDGMQ